MGLFSSIGSFIGGIASGIGKVAEGIVSTMGRSISTLGNLVSKVVPGFLSGIAGKALGFLKGIGGIVSGSLGPILGPIIAELAVKLIIKVISKIAEENEVVEKNERPEEIGYRLEEAGKHEDWKSRDEFKSFKDYYAYLKEQIPTEEIDTLRLKKDFGTYSVLGMQAEVYALEDKFNLRIPKTSLIEIGRNAMETKEVQAFIRVFNELGYKNLDISEYLKGTLPAGELERITTALLDALKFYFPEKNERDFLARLNEMRNTVNYDIALASIYCHSLQTEYGEQLQQALQAGELPKATEKILKDIDFKVEAKS